MFVSLSALNTVTVRIKAADATKEHEETKSVLAVVCSWMFFAPPFGVDTIMALFPPIIKMFSVI